MRKNQDGFSVVELVIILIVIAAIVVAGMFVMKRGKSDKPKSNVPETSNNSSTSGSWSFSGSEWKNSGTAPACPSPLSISSPTDVSKATGILYPGQYRGGNYKPHGGFRFANNLNDSVSVKLPMDAKLYKGSRYIEQGETQYLLVFINPCGMMFKFDHLLTLSSSYQKIVEDNFPPAQENNSQTTNLTKDIEAKAGDTIATAVGFKKTGNTTFDFGVYDLRSQNEISKNDQWATKHTNDKEYAPYAICWLDVLSGGDSAKVKALPAVDGVSGAISDYCKSSTDNTLTNTAGSPA